MKICSKCNVEKELTEFHTDSREKDKKSVHCKLCRKSANRARYLVDKEKILLNIKKYYHENKEAIRVTVKNNYTPERRSKYLEKKKSYRKTDRSKQLRKDWLAKNPVYTLLKNLRGRHQPFFRYNIKQGLDYSTTKDLGCSAEFFKQYIESKFEGGMTWDNYGIGNGFWNLDHIISLDYAIKNNLNLKYILHYLNLQPMWAISNIQKSNKVTTDVDKHLESIVNALNNK